MPFVVCIVRIMCNDPLAVTCQGQLALGRNFHTSEMAERAHPLCHRSVVSSSSWTRLVLVLCAPSRQLRASRRPGSGAPQRRPRWPTCCEQAVDPPGSPVQQLARSPGAACSSDSMSGTLVPDFAFILKVREQNPRTAFLFFLQEQR